MYGPLRARIDEHLAPVRAIDANPKANRCGRRALSRDIRGKTHPVISKVCGRHASAQNRDVGVTPDRLDEQSILTDVRRSG
jgi:hypothetical protein